MMPPQKMAELGEAMAAAIAANPNDNMAVHRALWEAKMARISELEEALWLLVGDVEAMHRSHIPGPAEPPITRDEIYHRDRAKALLAGYQPKDH